MNKLIVTAVALALLSAAVIVHHSRAVSCSWAAPLKTNYVLCTDGTVREK